MGVVFALVVSAAFGGADQYVGSLVRYPWGAEVASLSAPWLVLAFVAGCTQRTPRRAALLGLGCTYAALVGYLLMTDSPVEGAQYTLTNTRAFLISNIPVVVGGLFTGPLFGWFGQQWHTRRALVGALLSAGALCAEPLARHAPIRSTHLLGRDYLFITPIGSQLVVIAEVAAGLALAAYAALSRARARSPQYQS